MSYKVHPVSPQLHVKSAQKEPAKQKITSRVKLSKQHLFVLSKKNSLEEKKRSFGIREWLKLVEVIVYPNINYLS